MEKDLLRLDALLKLIFTKYGTRITQPAVLLSGGIDSSIITVLAQHYYPQVTPYCLTTQNSQDRPFVDLLCQTLHLQPTYITPTEDQIIKAVQILKPLLNENNIPPNLTQLSLAVATYLALVKIAKNGYEDVFSGQGPDILFAGYARYRKAVSLNQAIIQDLPGLEIDQKREALIANIFGLKLHYPYLDQRVIDFSLSLPPNSKIYNGVDKYLLRQYGKYLKLPQEIVNRPKKAFQHSTGIAKKVCAIQRVKMTR